MTKLPNASMVHSCKYCRPVRQQAQPEEKEVEKYQDLKRASKEPIRSLLSPSSLVPLVHYTSDSTGLNKAGFDKVTALAESLFAWIQDLSDYFCGYPRLNEPV